MDTGNSIVTVPWLIVAVLWLIFATGVAVIIWRLVVSRAHRRRPRGPAPPSGPGQPGPSGRPDTPPGA
jgi:hypothetical protein